MPLILASGSPRRKALLEDAGLSFTVCPPPPEAEPLPASGEDPADFAVRAASVKAGAVFAAHPSSLVLGADTVVALEGRILGKPQTHEEAYSFLTFLRGKTHDVITGCALVTEDTARTFFCRTRVDFWNCPDALLERYARSEEVLDKAGAYAIQGQGAFLVASLSGSWSNVVGLPVAELMAMLLENDLIRSTE